MSTTVFCLSVIAMSVASVSKDKTSACYCLFRYSEIIGTWKVTQQKWYELALVNKNEVIAIEQVKFLGKECIIKYRADANAKPSETKFRVMIPRRKTCGFILYVDNLDDERFRVIFQKDDKKLYLALGLYPAKWPTGYNIKKDVIILLICNKVNR